MFTFIFKETINNTLYRDDDISEYGKIDAGTSEAKTYIFSSTDIDEPVVNLGFYFIDENESGGLAMIRALGSEYQNAATQYGVYAYQEYQLNGSVGENLDATSPSLTVPFEQPTSILSLGDSFKFYLQKPEIDAGTGVVTDSINSVTWTDDGIGGMTPSGLPGSSGVIDYVTGLVTLTYTGTYDEPEIAAIEISYDQTHITDIRDPLRDEKVDDTLIGGQLWFVSGTGVQLSTKVTILGYDPITKVLELDSGLLDYPAASVPFVPSTSELYVIENSYKEYITKDVGYSPSTKIPVGSRGARLATPNEKTTITLGIDAPANIGADDLNFLSAFEQALEEVSLRLIFDYSLENE